MKVMAIIPARGGSKGVIDKNKKLIAGRPLIEYTLKAAVSSKKLAEIWVSSDDEEILGISGKYKVKLHRRPPDLASDISPVTDTVREVLRNADTDFDAVMILQPTSPLRTGDDIDQAVAILAGAPEVQSVISVVPMNDVHPARMYTLTPDTYLKTFVAEFEQVRRQEIPVAYYRNGSIYLTRIGAFRANNSMMNKPVKPYVMEYDWLLNIDSERDVLIANVLIPAWQKYIDK